MSHFQTITHQIFRVSPLQQCPNNMDENYPSRCSISERQKVLVSMKIASSMKYFLSLQIFPHRKELLRTIFKNPKRKNRRRLRFSLWIILLLCKQMGDQSLNHLLGINTKWAHSLQIGRQSQLNKMSKRISIVKYLSVISIRNKLMTKEHSLLSLHLNNRIIRTIRRR